MDNFENTLNLILDVAYQSDLRVYGVAYAEINRSNIVDLKHILKTVYDLACGEQQHRIDELQAKIDEVLKACDNLRTDSIREHCAEYDKGWKDCATSIYHQLKRVK